LGEVGLDVRRESVDAGGERVRELDEGVEIRGNFVCSLCEAILSLFVEE
jgi:hypothetical protein